MPIKIPKKSVTFVDIKVDRDLLNAKFDGYQLKLDPTPIVSTQTDAAIYIARASTQTQWSQQHVHSFATHNHLYVDAYETVLNCVYLVHKPQLHMITIEQHCYDKVTNTWISSPPLLCHSLPLDPSTDAFDANLVFVSPTQAVLCDGQALLYRFDTGLRAEQNGEQWKLISTTRLPHSPIILYDAAVLSGDRYVCLIGSIDEMKHAGAHVGSLFATKLETILVAPAEMYGAIPVASSLLHAHTHGLVHSAFLMSRAPDDGEEGGSKQTTHGKYDMLMACVASRRMVGITDEGQIEVSEAQIDDTSGLVAGADVTDQEVPKMKSYSC